MIATAILAIRNEEAYLANCLRHLVRNGIRFAIIDNGSTDSSAAIYGRHEFAASLVDVQELPFSGVFSLEEQLCRKKMIVDAIDTDWVIHLDADEMMHSYRRDETLNEALSRLDAAGWNAVNFDEYVFLPIDGEYPPELADFPPLEHYYFFEPRPQRLVRAWCKAKGFSPLEDGGHSLIGSDIRLAREHLCLRHYIVRSQAHAFVKYVTRKFAADELARGWHYPRANNVASSFRFPPTSTLKRLACVQDRELDRSDPWTMHFWQLGNNLQAE
jgi:hypothetical protein